MKKIINLNGNFINLLHVSRARKRSDSVYIVALTNGHEFDVSERTLPLNSFIKLWEKAVEEN